VSDRTYKSVNSILGDAGTVELVGLLGYYAMVAMTLDVFRGHVETEWERLKGGPQTVTDAEIARLASFFDAPAYVTLPGDDTDA
jgi:hypothetical protein